LKFEILPCAAVGTKKRAFGLFFCVSRRTVQSTESVEDRTVQSTESVEDRTVQSTESVEDRTN
jgi:hypothetical protein